MIIVQLLRGYYGKHLNKWNKNLIYVQYSYNKVIHILTNKTPFKIWFGYLLPSLFDCIFKQHKDSNETILKKEKQDENLLKKLYMFTLRCKNNLKLAKQNTSWGIINIELIINSKWEIKFDSILARKGCRYQERNWNLLDMDHLKLLNK